MIDREELFFRAFVGGALIFLIVIIFVGVNDSMKMSEYISDHKCVVTETKTETHLQPMLVGKVTTLIPMTSEYSHYRCKIDGDRGRNFWY